MKTCPFCGVEPTWKTNAGDWGYTPPSIRLGCENRACPVKPGLSRFTEGWEQGRGHFDIDPRDEMIEAWETRP